MRGIIIVFIGSLLLFSCKENNKEKEETGFQVSGQLADVWALHDEIMPRMGELGTLKKELKTLEDSIGTSSEFTDAKEQLKLASKDMHRWMDEFDMSKKENEKYMDDQVIQLNKMKELFETSINNAEEIISTHK